MNAAHLFARVRMRLSADSTRIGSHGWPPDPYPSVSGESEEVAVPVRVLLSSGRYIHFGPFRVDQQREEVSRDRTRIKLQGKVYQTLLALLEKPGEVVTREELRMRLWRDHTHVNYDANVNTAVNKLRHALEDSSDEPVYIETISKKGYRFLVQPEVAGMPENGQLRSEEPSEGVQVPTPTIAVSRFSKSDLWMVLRAIGLILAGMILGAGIMSLWINRTSKPHRALAGFDLNHGRSPSGSCAAPSIKPLSLDSWVESLDLHGAGRSAFPISMEFMPVFFLKQGGGEIVEKYEIDGTLQNLEVSNERLPIGVS